MCIQQYEMNFETLPSRLGRVCDCVAKPSALRTAAQPFPPAPSRPPGMCAAASLPARPHPAHVVVCRRRGRGRAVPRAHLAVGPAGAPHRRGAVVRGRQCGQCGRPCSGDGGQDLRLQLRTAATHVPGAHTRRTQAVRRTHTSQGHMAHSQGHVGHMGNSQAQMGHKRIPRQQVAQQLRPVALRADALSTSLPHPTPRQHRRP